MELMEINFWYESSMKDENRMVGKIEFQKSFCRKITLMQMKTNRKKLKRELKRIRKDKSGKVL